jgi:hypothetical protein
LSFDRAGRHFFLNLKALLRYYHWFCVTLQLSKVSSVSSSTFKHGHLLLVIVSFLNFVFIPSIPWIPVWISKILTQRENNPSLYHP